MLRWEPEGRYRHRHCTAIAPFWFSTEHLWIMIAPFWLSPDDIYSSVLQSNGQLRPRRALLQIKDVPLRTRRALLTLYSTSALLVLNGTSLSCNNALLALNWRYSNSVWLYICLSIVQGFLHILKVCTLQLASVILLFLFILFIFISKHKIVHHVDIEQVQVLNQFWQ